MSATKSGESGGGVTTTTLSAPAMAVSSSNSSVSSNAAIATTTIAAAPPQTTTIRNNVSVTSIKCEIDDVIMANNGSVVAVGGGVGVGGGGGGGGGAGSGCIRIPLLKHDDSDSETELTHIENLKVTRRATSASGSGSGSGNGGGHPNATANGVGAEVTFHHKNGPRPMSWEGELSEAETAETELMETENSMSNEPLKHHEDGHNPKLPVLAATEPPHHQPQHQLHQQQHYRHQHQQQQQQHQQHPHSNQHLNQHQHQHQHHPLHASASASSLQAAVKADLDHVSVEIHGSGGGGLLVAGGKLKLTPTQSDPINLKYEPPDAGGIAPGGGGGGGVNSPVLTRQKSTNLPLPLPANPSPDSAIHSVYTHSSPSQSPLTSRHAPYTPSLSRNNSDASHSSCYSYSSEFSPTHSPIQGRHAAACSSAGPLYASFNNSLHHSVLYRPLSVESGIASSNHLNHVAIASDAAQNLSLDSKAPLGPLALNTNNNANTNSSTNTNTNSSSGSGSGTATGDGLVSSAAGISRQQLINSPCPICGDKISGFHYGIFSCESCKGFFKRTVQNRKNYVCVRGGPCPVSISTRKKCPACRFEKCLQKGMKLEAIREDRTRGGRSTYQCSYTLPTSILSPLLGGDHQAQAQAQTQVQAVLSPGGQHHHHHHHHHHQQQQQQQQHPQHPQHLQLQQPQQGVAVSVAVAGQQQHGLSPPAGPHGGLNGIKSEQAGDPAPLLHVNGTGSSSGSSTNSTAATATLNGAAPAASIPALLQEIMNVEYLWQYNEAELARLNQPIAGGAACGSSMANQMTNPLLASAGFSSTAGENANPDLIAHLCNVADHRLYKIVKWCKSLPLFKNISIDDQICLLINSWCELLLFSCCYRSIDTPGEIKMSQGKKITLAQAKSNGLQACIERMLNLTDHLRRLRVDRYEYVAMKVIVLLQSDTSELKEPVKVRECQEKALQSLQAYTLAHYPDIPSKFGELLLRIPDLQRTCQLGKEMLTIKSRDDGDFNLLVELLRGEH